MSSINWNLMPTWNPFLRPALLSAFFMLNSCVQDVALDQIDEVVIPPEAAIDLVYFSLASHDFTAAAPNQSRRMAIDTVRLEFLDDDYIRDGLREAKFEFKYTNGFSYPLTSTVTFLSENNAMQYQFSFPIAAGNPGTPKTTAYIELIGKKNIEAIVNSIKMKIELKMQPGSSTFPGELQLKSKAVYTFEF